MIGLGVVLFVVLAAEAGYVEALEMALGFEEQASKFYVDVAERS
jgi:rubrerythrin